MELTLGQRKAISKARLGKWPKASRAEKSAILDAVCEVTAWHRDHARKAIRQALADQAAGGPPPRKPRAPLVVYGPEVIELLTRCWAVLDGPTVDDHDHRRLAELLEATDLIGLKHRIADIQGNLIQLARRRGRIQPRARANAVYLSGRKLNSPRRAKPDEPTTHPSRAS